MRLKEILDYSKKIESYLNKDMSQERKKITLLDLTVLEIPWNFEKRAQCISRYLSAFFAHEFILESDVFSSLEKLIEFISMMFRLIKGHEKYFVRKIY